MEQELGQGWADGIHPEDLTTASATYYSSFDARRSFQMEYRLRRADGEYRWVLDNGTPLYREGEFAGYIGSCIDVTEQKAVEERCAATKSQLTDSAASRESGAAGNWTSQQEESRWSDEWYRIFGYRETFDQSFRRF
jgi:hypothetical protein